MNITIGVLSERSGVKVETIRYYERVGLIPVPARTQGKHRLYGIGDIKRLIFVRRSRELGFSLADIRGLLQLAERGRTCGEVREMTLAHVSRIRQKMADLQRMQRLLRDTASQCKGGEAPECPILDVLGADGGGRQPDAAAASRPSPDAIARLGCRHNASTTGHA